MYEMSPLQAAFVVEAYEAYLLRHDGYGTTEIGSLYGIHDDTVRYRLKKVEEYISNRTLDSRLREARNILDDFKTINAPKKKEEKLPVRCVSGCRFSPLH